MTPGQRAEELLHRPRPGRRAPRTRLTLLTITMVFALQLVLQSLVAPAVPHGPLMVRAPFSPSIVVLSLGYLVMPVLTRRLVSWP